MTDRAHGPTLLCRFDDLPDPGARGFVLGRGPDALDLIVVRQGGGVRAYRNACPHQGTPLETFPDKFLDAEGAHLVCSTHGARFRLADGHCVSGPCQGKRLEPVQVTLEQGQVVLPIARLHGALDGS